MPGSVSPVKVEGLDPGIEHAVTLLRAAGFETFDSCESGEGHAFHKPTIFFYGDLMDGLRAFALLEQQGIRVSSIALRWRGLHGVLRNPTWDMELYPS